MFSRGKLMVSMVKNLNFCNGKENYTDIPVQNSEDCYLLDTNININDVQRNEVVEFEIINDDIASQEKENELIENIDTQVQSKTLIERSKKPKSHEWKKNENKTKRMLGKEYLGLTKSSETKKNCQEKLRGPRQLRDTCTSSFCLKSSFRHCSSFSPKKREEIFELFWQMNWDQKKTYVANLVECAETKRKYSNEDSRRLETRYYHLLNENKRVKVCRKMFLNTLGLNEKMVRNWVNKSENYGIQLNPKCKLEKRKVNYSRSSIGMKNAEKHNYLNTFLNDFPKLESHYCRKDSKKLYVQTEINSKNRFFELYEEKCKTDNCTSLSFPVFDNAMKELNISLYKPRKDECNTCMEYKAKNLGKDDYAIHRQNIEEMRKGKLEDVLLAQGGKCALFCMDVQAVKLLPKLNANASYYKMKLQLHNFTIYDIITHDSTNYMWDETEGELDSNVFTTIITEHIKKYLESNENTRHFIIYSDGCGYQNRNVTLSNALSYLCIQKNIKIEQKYFVTGHSQMECDSTHSLIERKIKNQLIYLPSQFIQLSRQARKNPKPLEIVHLNHDFFLDHKAVPTRIKSIRPGKLAGDPTVNMVRCFCYDPDGKIYFKIKLHENYEILPQRISTVAEIKDPQPIYKGRIPISKQKWDHLQQLKPMIPNDCHLFYDNIPYSTK